MEFERKKRGNTELNLIPLINIIFLLLIFFVVCGSVARFEIIDIDPPAALSGKIMDQGEMVIMLGRREEIILNDDIVSDVDELMRNIQNRLKSNPAQVITIKADANLPATKMIQVLDRIKEAGGRNLSLMTQAEAS